MVANNRGGTRSGRSGRTSRNNNPEGRNQYNGASGTAREHPLATAAAIGGAVAAGIFLWSRRNQISDQIGDLAGQISDWREDRAGSGDEFASTDEDFTPGTGGGRSQMEIAEEALTLKETGQTA